MKSDPIFILACSPRTGSTWIQRVLTSTGDVLVWGESSSFIFPSFPMWSLDGDKKNEKNPHDLKQFREKRANMWMAVLQPYLSDFNDAMKKFLVRLYEIPAKREGYDQWGLKLTSWNRQTVQCALEQWKHSKIVFLTRSFEASFASRFKLNPTVQHASRWIDIHDFCSTWVEQHQVAMSFRNHDRCKFLQYEDVVREQKSFKDLIHWLGLSDPDPKQYREKISYSGHEDFTIPYEDSMAISAFRSRIDALTKNMNDYFEEGLK